MLYALICHDAPNTLETRLAIRPKHLERLTKLHEEGRVAMAGALAVDEVDLSQGFKGSIIIVDFENRAALDEWIADEPFLKAGVYFHIDVHPFRKALP